MDSAQQEQHPLLARCILTLPPWHGQTRPSGEPFDGRLRLHPLTPEPPAFDGRGLFRGRCSSVPVVFRQGWNSISRLPGPLSPLVPMFQSKPTWARLYLASDSFLLENKDGARVLYMPIGMNGTTGTLNYIYLLMPFLCAFSLFQCVPGGLEQHWNNWNSRQGQTRERPGTRGTGATGQRGNHHPAGESTRASIARRVNRYAFTSSPLMRTRA